MSQTIRSFIALELPEAVKSLLGDVQQELTALRPEVRWVRPQNIHLTLKFLGNIQPGDIDAIGRAVDETAEASARFTLNVGSLGVFPDTRRARVIWLGLGGEVPALLHLQQDLEARLAVLGFAREKRPFKAHLTLGRFRRAPNPEVLGQAVQAHTDQAPLNFRVERIILFKSDLKPSGAQYSKLKHSEILRGGATCLSQQTNKKPWTVP